MTEEEWLAADDVSELTHFKASRNDRKRRLLACACCRRVLPLLTDDRFAAAVAASERYADGEIKWPAMLTVRKAVRAARVLLDEANPKEHEADAADAALAVTEKAFMHYQMAVEHAAYAQASKTRPKWNRGHKSESAAQLALARDIFGNPFRPVTFAKCWRTSAALSLARSMYEGRDFSAMPVLADALQEAGCEDPQVLNHCRTPGLTHVRGCWVVDGVLGMA